MTAQSEEHRPLEVPADIHQVAADIRRQALQHPDRDPVVRRRPAPRTAAKRKPAPRKAAKRKTAKKAAAKKAATKTARKRSK